VNREKSKNIVLLMAMILGMCMTPANAVGSAKQLFTPTSKVSPLSNRLIVKLRAAKPAQMMGAMQINSARDRLLSAQVMEQLQATTGVPMKELRAMGNDAHVLRMDAAQTKQTVEQVISNLRALPNVEYVEQDHFEYLQAVPNDADYALLWAMQPVNAVVGTSSGYTGNYGGDFETAWNTSTGTGVVVAVIDSGITAHPDIVGTGGSVSPLATGNLVSPGYDFIQDCRIRGTCAANTSDVAATIPPASGGIDTGGFLTATDITNNPSLFGGMTSANSSWHGTHVAGTIAAIGNNNLGVIGGAHGAKILPVRALGKGGIGFASDISEAILWAAGVHPTIPNPNPARVINMSLGSTSECGVTRQSAIDAAVAAGAVVVVAAGNEDSDIYYSSPANCKKVISVAAVGKDGSRAVYSNFSSPSNTVNKAFITLAAQGSDTPYVDPLNPPLVPPFDPGIYSLVDTGATTPAGAGYGYKEGTSMATPQVSAAVALMLARNPALTPAQVKTILSSPASLTAFPSFVSGWAMWDCSLKQNCGAGILNANLAVQNSLPLMTVTLGNLDFGTTPVNTVVADRTITLTNSAGTPIALIGSVIGGAQASRFLVVSPNTCDNATIASGATCQITVRYASSQGMTNNSTLALRTATSTAAIIGLQGVSGYGLSSSATLTAPNVEVGQTVAVDVVFTNHNSVQVTPAALEFSMAFLTTATDGCSNVPLAPAATCVVRVNISRPITGSYSGNVLLGLTNTAVPKVSVNISGLVVSAGTTPTTTPSTNPTPAGGGGGCSIMPIGSNPDYSLILAMLSMMVYLLARRRSVRSED